MLVLTRKAGESIHIGDGIVVTVLAVSGGRIRIGIEAPAEVSIKRGELIQLPTTQRDSVSGHNCHSVGHSMLAGGFLFDNAADQEPCPAI